MQMRYCSLADVYAGSSVIHILRVVWKVHPVHGTTTVTVSGDEKTKTKQLDT